MKRALLFMVYATAALAALALFAAALWFYAGNYTPAPLHNPGQRVGTP